MKLLHAAISRALLLALIAFGVIACSSLGAPAPKTFIERVAAVQVGVTALRDSATSLLSAGSIGVADAKNVRSSADNANEAIDLAVTAYKLACPASTPPAPCASPGADAKLASALSILTAAQTYLRTKGKP